MPHLGDFEHHLQIILKTISFTSRHWLTLDYRYLYQSYFRIFKKHLLPNRLGKVAVQPISLATQEAQGPTTPVNLHLNLILSSKITVANSSCCRSNSKLFHLRRIAF